MSATDDEFGAFARSRAAPLHRAAYLLCGDWHLADDLVQEALAKTFRHWRKVRRIDHPDAYVRRILINEANNHFRRQRTTAPPVDISGRDDPADPAHPDASGGLARRDLLLTALLALPDRQRATVVLRYLEGLSEAETADVLGCSLGTVKSQTSRALHTLNRVIARLELPL